MKSTAVQQASLHNKEIEHLLTAKVLNFEKLETLAEQENDEISKKIFKENEKIDLEIVRLLST